MTKRVLSVGQCAVDHAAISRLIEGSFAATVVPAASAVEALDALRGGSFELVLVNRKLDADSSDGLDIVRAIKQDPQVRATPVMLVTNYPEHQQAAIEAGAEPGFGKHEYDRPETPARLARFLG
jgi:CheY-like chemotaxis protein